MIHSGAGFHFESFEKIFTLFFPHLPRYPSLREDKLVTGYSNVEKFVKRSHAHVT